MLVILHVGMLLDIRVLHQGLFQRILLHDAQALVVRSNAARTSAMNA
jgi:hypothetical protein